MEERLQKVLSKAGIASRREAEKLITGGHVRVNGNIVTTLGTKVNSYDRVTVDGKKISAEEKVYLLFYKPKGVVTTLSDPEGRKTVFDYIKISQRIVPVGRLDYNTEGLLILTNDGDLINKLTHPRHHVDKKYQVVVLGIAPEEKLDLLRAGIKLEDGVTAPAKVNLIEYDHDKNVSKLEIIIHEGKNRQIRRMCEAIGHPVRSLKRTQIAFLNLQGLRRGQYRILTPAEVTALYESSQAKG